jgi:hypothetical protein
MDRDAFLRLVVGHFLSVARSLFPTALSIVFIGHRTDHKNNHFSLEVFAFVVLELIEINVLFSPFLLQFLDYLLVIDLFNLHSFDCFFIHD